MGLLPRTRTVALLPGSRAGEAARHMPTCSDAIELLRRQIRLPVSTWLRPKVSPNGGSIQLFGNAYHALSIKVIEDETWDVLAHADLALAASGTVTVEAAVLGTPMVTFYKVTQLSWWAGRRW